MQVGCSLNMDVWRTSNNKRLLSYKFWVCITNLGRTSSIFSKLMPIDQGFSYPYLCLNWYRWTTYFHAQHWLRHYETNSMHLTHWRLSNNTKSVTKSTMVWVISKWQTNNFPSQKDKIKGITILHLFILACFHHSNEIQVTHNQIHHSLFTPRSVIGASSPKGD
jgi:hypothetical protein